MIAGALLIEAPKSLVKHYGHFRALDDDQYTRQINEFLRTIIQSIGLPAGLVALWFVWRRTRATEETLEVTKKSLQATREALATTREGQITDRFAKAIEHLGASDKDGKKLLELRFGGIYALERIAKDSPKDHGSIVEILTAYVRQNSPWREPAREVSENDVNIRNALDEDIQAILTVIGRRDFRNDEQWNLDLSGVDLRELSLTNAYLKNAIPLGAHLEGARLNRVDLRGAFLDDAHPERALLIVNFDGARLERANLRSAGLLGALLVGAVLKDAQLQGAMFFDSDIERAILTGANLEGALFGIPEPESSDRKRANLTGAHLENANLSHAALWGVVLAGAHLQGANLDRAHLEGADLRGASGLTTEQVSRAFVDKSTKLPDYLS
jgi:uncharacterized protein YjbI with pentapeptide repeats